MSPRFTFDTEGYAQPLHAPLYFARKGQTTPWHKSLTITFKADPNTLARFVPEPLEPLSGEMAAVVTEHYQPGHGLPVRGATVIAHVAYKGVEGRYYVLAINTADEVLGANREELGMAVVHGDVKLWAEGNTWWGTGSRDGEELFEVSMFPHPGEATGHIDSFYYRPMPNYHYKRIPSAVEGRKPWLQILKVTAATKGSVTENWAGRGSVWFNKAHWGPGGLQPVELVGATYRVSTSGVRSDVECVWEDR